MTITAPITPELLPADDTIHAPEIGLLGDSIRATVEDLIAATRAGQTARRAGEGPGMSATLDALIGTNPHETAHRTRDLLHAYRRGWRSAAPVRPAAPKHRAEIAAPVIEEAAESGRNLMPVVVLFALALVPTAAVIAALSFLAA